MFLIPNNHHCGIAASITCISSELMVYMWSAGHKLPFFTFTLLTQLLSLLSLVNGKQKGVFGVPFLAVVSFLNIIWVTQSYTSLAYFRHLIHISPHARPAKAPGNEYILTNKSLDNYLNLPNSFLFFFGGGGVSNL